MHITPAPIAVGRFAGQHTWVPELGGVLKDALTFPDVSKLGYGQKFGPKAACSAFPTLVAFPPSIVQVVIRLNGCRNRYKLV
jgi:hypothetical protein